MIRAGTYYLRRSQRGIALIWVTVSLVAVIAVIALALDTAMLVLAGQQLQVAADAGALAAAGKVRSSTDDARTAAVTIAAANKAIGEPVQLNRNDANAAGGEIVVGRYDREARTFTPQTTGVNAVRVIANRTASSHGAIPLIFGPAFGTDTANVSRQAIAMIGGGRGANLLVLDDRPEPESDCALQMKGNANLLLQDGDGVPLTVQVNSPSNSAVCGTGGSWYIDGSLAIVGDARGDYTSHVREGIDRPVDPIPDPLADLPDIAESDWGPIQTVPSRGGAMSPGYYPAGFERNNGTYVLEPGIYVLNGPGMKLTGSVEVDATAGCMFYIVGTGSVEITGDFQVTMEPPDPEVNTFPGADVYEGISIFQARSNTNRASMTGNSGLDIEGAICFPRNQLDLTGSGAGFGNQVIAWRLSIDGSGDINITSTGPLHGVGNKVFLVH